jgi:predicted transport protein
MKNLFATLQQKIIALDGNILIKPLPTYFSFKLQKNDKLRSFADVYVNKKAIKVQVSSKLINLKDYRDTRKILYESNEDWTLGYRFYISSLEDTEYALRLIYTSYSAVNDYLNFP